MKNSLPSICSETCFMANGTIPFFPTLCPLLVSLFRREPLVDWPRRTDAGCTDDWSMLALCRADVLLYLITDATDPITWCHHARLFDCKGCTGCLAVRSVSHNSVLSVEVSNRDRIVW